MYNIQIVDVARIMAVIEDRDGEGNRGLYLCEHSGGDWVAVNNKTADAWTEEFKDQFLAIKWLMGEYEIGDDEFPDLDYLYIYMADLNEEAKKRANEIYQRQGWDKATDNELVTIVEVRHCDI